MKRSLSPEKNSSCLCYRTKVSHNNNIMPANHKIFNDSVHGHMKFHPICVAIIDTPQFQRLRNIKQTSTTYLVYPGACHNRFEHSLGVSYLGGCMVDALVHNTPGLHITAEEKLSVELAGLCHDLGHGPFSHTWEKFLRRFDSHWKHEQGSEEVLDYLIEDNKLGPLFESYNLNLNLIKELIRGGGESLPADKRFLYQIIANKETDIDVDKWDYFLRDGHQLNLKITFDYRRLLSFCTVVKRPTDSGPTIAFRNKEASNIFDMFRVRADLHLRAYQHCATKNTELVLLDALVAANEFYQVEADGKMYKLSEAHTNVKALCKLTDHIQYIIAYSSDPRFGPAQKLLHRLIARDLYTLLGKFNLSKVNGNRFVKRPKLEGSDQVADLEAKLNRKFAPLEFALTTIYINLGSSGNPLDKVVFYKKPESASTLEVDNQIRWDKVFSNFPFDISKNPNQKELLVFCKSKVSEYEKEKIVQYLNTLF
ncbi:hypothetical protein M8J77_025419 [Diaphorina citri]|nr:hypothetical protein M8J77_025419 [Diaphorina citri]